MYLSVGNIAARIHNLDCSATHLIIVIWVVEAISVVNKKHSQRAASSLKDVPS